MLELQPLVVLLHAAQFLELRGHVLLDLHTLRHDPSLTRLLAPTRQHERVDVKRLRDVPHRNARQLAQLHRRRLESLAVLVRRPRPWSWHLTLLNWTSPSLQDTAEPRGEARSKASGLTPPR